MKELKINQKVLRLKNTYHFVPENTIGYIKNINIDRNEFSVRWNNKESFYYPINQWFKYIKLIDRDVKLAEPHIAYNAKNKPSES